MRSLWLWKIIAVTALIIAYLVVEALDMNVSIIAPVIVAAIALILFLPFRPAGKRQHDAEV
ncbi:hypothetical protein HCH15_07265 [Corynebacterium testudinoris]|uniref:Uncharacterized protein n=1 Tax=Corynebacterium testudinoris TaxID=136857 RepID=A0A0G3H922_9CORY|nr:hypothetical protein [Corynebacterium testudinoris]AKK09235.1 hypothetical protein CTEST_09030 [Corynebacterium testudinoris]MBX8995982.1 hypothetical protein [Corynebacterium testudinoris]